MVDEVERLWVASDAILDRLEALPQCLCHLDAHRLNLFAVGSQTVAIDWAMIGNGGYGEDLANLVHLTVAINGVNRSEVPELRETAYAAYLEGLRDAGWEGDERHVRFGYLAHTCVRNNTMWAWAVIDLSLLNQPLSEEERPSWARYLRTTDETVLDEVRWLHQDARAQGRELLKLLAETG